MSISDITKQAGEGVELPTFAQITALVADRLWSDEPFGFTPPSPDGPFSYENLWWWILKLDPKANASLHETNGETFMDFTFSDGSRGSAQVHENGLSSWEIIEE